MIASRHTRLPGSARTKSVVLAPTLAIFQSAAPSGDQRRPCPTAGQTSFRIHSRKILMNAHQTYAPASPAVPPVDARSSRIPGSGAEAAEEQRYAGCDGARAGSARGERKAAGRIPPTVRAGLPIKAPEQRRGMIHDDTLLTPPQIAKQLQVSVAWVRDHSTRKQPRLPVIRVGGLLRFHPDDIDQWLEDLRATGRRRAS